MKSLGKQAVIITTLLPEDHHKPRRSQLEMRVVYEKPDGTFWINWLNGKRQVTRDATGAYEFTQKIGTVTRHAADVFLKSMGSRVVL